MVRVAVISLRGNFENGFNAMLHIGEAGKSPSAGCPGRLPPNPDMPQKYHEWRSNYSNLGKHLRILRDIEGQTVRFSSIQACNDAALQLKMSLNQWLNSAEFLALKHLLKETHQSEEIRIIIQNNEIDLLRRLPWHLWDFIQSHNAEVAISSPAYKLTQRTQRLRIKPRILVILGNSQGIDVEVDRLLWEKLEKEKNAEIVYLVEPELYEIRKALWHDELGWDILFFAGHGSSYFDGTQAKLYINRQESIGISDLNEALQIAIKKGLRLAIFNSCEGLGLVQELENLHIPQVIVMKEPVPDQVAQEFLKYFLEYFTAGESLYVSVRQAREKLQHIENTLPSATWLPVICQNPAELPLTWEELTPPRFEYVSKILEYMLRGILSSKQTITTAKIADSSPLKITELTLVNEFWKSNFRQGELVAIAGSLSQYAPMFIGAPKLKREVHRGYRRAIPLEDVEDPGKNRSVIDANLAFTAGQMVIRLNPEEVATDWVYMGLYHSIVRNSIPVFIDKNYYINTVQPLFEKNGDRLAYAVEAKVTGRIIPFPGNFFHDFFEKNNIKSYIKPELVHDAEKDVFAIFVDGNQTNIEYIGRTKFLDGDIWVALKSGVEEFFISRFIDLSDIEDFQQEVAALVTEAQEILPNTQIVYQFDQVEKPLLGYQTVDALIKKLYFDKLKLLIIFIWMLFS